MLEINPMWMVEIQEWLTLPFQYIAKTITEDY